ncbi:MAG: FkbM family methyltransferase [Syntrophaceae bacterium]|nr:FkbM family methyltransferase [Syntrophaceae bacterium]
MIKKRSGFGVEELERLVNSLDITCLDIGARGGVVGDLLPIAPAVHAIGFEPDRHECERLNKDASTGKCPWKSIRYIPIALWSGEEAKLNLYRKRGCSSLLRANMQFAKEYGRDDYYILEDVISLKSARLDDVAIEHSFAKADYIKIDVQGAEMEVFESGRNLIQDSVMVIRAEVAFMSLYEGQPLFSDIDRYLREKGYSFIDFCEMHRWRTITKVKHPYLCHGAVPYSKGRLAHADVLYMKNHMLYSDRDEEGVRKLLNLAMLAMCYEQLDMARAIFEREGVREYLRANYQMGNADAIVGSYSRYLARRFRRRYVLDSIRAAVKMFFRK